MKQPTLALGPILRSRKRRRGIALVYTAALMLFILMITSMVIDMTFLYGRKTSAERSADAAALAGAWQVANAKGVINADAQARYYASLPGNGNYVYGVNGADVKIEYPAAETDAFGSVVKDSSNKPITHDNWYRVTVSRPERTFFALAEHSKSKYLVTASATATWDTEADINIKGLGTYGVAPGPVNVSVFGPNGKYSYGDCYSTQFLDDGTTVNPKYNPNGYDFLIKVPKNFTDTSLEIFDPDCYNPNGPDSGNGQVDEYRRQDGSTGTVADATTTMYSLYDDRGTPDPKDDILLYQKPYGADATTDNKWVDFYTGNRQLLPNSNFRLNVTSTAGSSENGFDLRIGPKRATPTTPFDPNNGSSIAAQGSLPINFNQSGKVKIALGNLPVQAAGGSLTISKFDTDVGATSIVYTCSTLPGVTFPGILSENGKFAVDTFKVPSTYTTEGTWYAEYQAAVGDTSVWDMSYSNSGPGRPGRIRLIR